MSTIDRTRLLVTAGALGALALIAGACGSTGVYVGVAVPGPWVGYPGVGYPGYVGRPPVVYREDALNETAERHDHVAVSDTPGTGTSSAGLENRCASPGRDDATCESPESGSTTDSEGAGDGQGSAKK